MTDNEIIKALECCGVDDCDECPYYTEEFGCDHNLQLLALDLIKRQQAEIEKLQSTTVVELQNTVLKISAILGELEIRREQIRTEAIKEFATRVKNGCGRVKTEGHSMLVCQESSFDYLVKEMTKEK